MSNSDDEDDYSDLKGKLSDEENFSDTENLKEKQSAQNSANINQKGNQRSM